MAQWKVGMGTAARRSLTSRASGQPLRRLCASFIGLGMAGALIAAERCLAQDNMRLTVRPREMATGTRTDRAGGYRLDNADKAPVYVPRKCVGARRCPLLLFLHPRNPFGMMPLWEMGPVAEKHEIILLDLDAYSPGLDWPGYLESRSAEDTRRAVDVALKELLQRFAIDPGKIAVIGYGTAAGTAMRLGQANTDVFSRIGSVINQMVFFGKPDKAAGDPPVKSPAQTTEYFLSTTLDAPGRGLDEARRIRQKGYQVKYVNNSPSDLGEWVNYDFMERWLQESWTIPNPAARTAPYVFPEPAPVLTTEAIAQMAAFWTRFAEEPDSIWTTARLAHIREVIVPVGTKEHTSIWMVDMPALAAKHPSVAAALKAAGLTARQHDAYRAALASARVTKNVDSALVGPVEPTSALAKNIAFMNAHQTELRELRELRMWDTP